MRHRKKFNHLGRKSAHRKETLSSLATSLILHKRINTTLAKAKALRVYVEPLITKSKVDSTHSRRTVFGYLGSKQAVSELFREVAQKVTDRPGGYTRILKTGFRKGDSAEMCFIELVDYNTNMLKVGDEEKQKTTRRGRRKKADEESSAIPGAASAKKVKEKTETTVSTVEEVTGDQVEEVVDTTVAEIVDEPLEEVAEETVAEVSDEASAKDATGGSDSPESETEEEKK